MDYFRIHIKREPCVSFLHGFMYQIDNTDHYNMVLIMMVAMIMIPDQPWQFSYFPGLHPGCLCASDHNFHVIFHVLSSTLLFLTTEYRMCEFASRLHNNLAKHLSPISKKVLSALPAGNFLTVHRQVNFLSKAVIILYLRLPWNVHVVSSVFCWYGLSYDCCVFVNCPLSAN